MYKVATTCKAVPSYLLVWEATVVDDVVLSLLRVRNVVLSRELPMNNRVLRSYLLGCLHPVGDDAQLPESLLKSQRGSSALPSVSSTSGEISPTTPFSIGSSKFRSIIPVAVSRALNWTSQSSVHLKLNISSSVVATASCHDTEAGYQSCSSCPPLPAWSTTAPRGCRAVRVPGKGSKVEP